MTNDVPIAVSMYSGITNSNSCGSMYTANASAPVAHMVTPDLVPESTSMQTSYTPSSGAKAAPLAKARVAGPDFHGW